MLIHPLRPALPKQSQNMDLEVPCRPINARHSSGDREERPVLNPHRINRNDALAAGRLEPPTLIRLV